jgi:cyclic pyranopterin phosphate synthase
MDVQESNKYIRTVDGRMRLCLLSESEIDILGSLRRGASRADLKQMIIDTIWEKPFGHELRQAVIPSGRAMSQIGG